MTEAQLKRQFVDWLIQELLKLLEPQEAGQLEADIHTAEGFRLYGQSGVGSRSQGVTTRQANLYPRPGTTYPTVLVDGERVALGNTRRQPQRRPRRAVGFAGVGAQSLPPIPQPWAGLALPELDGPWTVEGVPTPLPIYVASAGSFEDYTADYGEPYVFLEAPLGSLYKYRQDRALLGHPRYGSELRPYAELLKPVGYSGGPEKLVYQSALEGFMQEAPYSHAVSLLEGNLPGSAFAEVSPVGWAYYLWGVRVQAEGAPFPIEISAAPALPGTGWSAGRVIQLVQAKDFPSSTTVTLSFVLEGMSMATFPATGEIQAATQTRAYSSAHLAGSSVAMQSVSGTSSFREAFVGSQRGDLIVDDNLAIGAPVDYTRTITHWRNQLYETAPVDRVNLITVQKEMPFHRFFKGGYSLGQRGVLIKNPGGVTNQDNGDPTNWPPTLNVQTTEIVPVMEKDGMDWYFYKGQCLSVVTFPTDFDAAGVGYPEDTVFSNFVFIQSITEEAGRRYVTFHKPIPLGPNTLVLVHACTYRPAENDAPTEYRVTERVRVYSKPYWLPVARHSGATYIANVAAGGDAFARIEYKYEVKDSAGNWNYLANGLFNFGADGFYDGFTNTEHPYLTGESEKAVGAASETLRLGALSSKGGIERHREVASYRYTLEEARHWDPGTVLECDRLTISEPWPPIGPLKRAPLDIPDADAALIFPSTPNIARVELNYDDDSFSSFHLRPYFPGNWGLAQRRNEITEPMRAPWASIGSAERAEVDEHLQHIVIDRRNTDRMHNPLSTAATSTFRGLAWSERWYVADALRYADETGEHVCMAVIAQTASDYLLRVAVDGAPVYEGSVLELFKLRDPEGGPPKRLTFQDGSLWPPESGVGVRPHYNAGHPEWPFDTMYLRPFSARMNDPVIDKGWDPLCPIRLFLESEGDYPHPVKDSYPLPDYKP